MLAFSFGIWVWCDEVGVQTATRNAPKATTDVPNKPPTPRHNATSTSPDSKSPTALFNDPSTAKKIGLSFSRSFVDA